MGEGSPDSSTSSGKPFSCELEGPIASLLGTGVVIVLTEFFLKAGFLTELRGIALMAFEVSLACRTPFDDAFEGVGVLEESFLEKKLRMLPFWEDGVARSVARGAGVALFSFFTMMALSCSLTMLQKNTQSNTKRVN